MTTTKKQQVYEILKSEICSGKFPFGSQIYEQELANRFGSSRSPIREALKQLVSDGLVEEFPNRGIFVREYSEKDIEDIFDLRFTLESYAIRHAGKYITMDTVKELHECRDRMKKYLDEHDADAYAVEDAFLHHRIMELGNNKLVTDTYERTGALIEQFRMCALQSDKRFVDSYEEHCNLIDRLLEGNMREAERVEKEHLYCVKEAIIKYVKALEK